MPPKKQTAAAKKKATSAKAAAKKPAAVKKPDNKKDNKNSKKETAKSKKEEEAKSKKAPAKSAKSSKKNKDTENAAASSSSSPAGKNNKSSNAENSKSSKKKKNEPKSEVDIALESLEALFTKEYDLPAESLIRATFAPALSVAANERHEYHKAFVDMVQIRLNDINQLLTQQYEEQHQFIQQADTTKMRIENNVQRLKYELEQLERQNEMLEGKIAADKVQVTSKQEALQRAEREKTEEFKRLEGLEANRLYIQEVKDNQYRILKDSPPSAKKDFEKTLSAVRTCCEQKIKMEDSLLGALPAALKKSPEERGPFDRFTITEVDRLIEEWLNKCRMDQMQRRDLEVQAEQRVSEAERQLADIQGTYSEDEQRLEQLQANIEQTSSDLGNEEKALKEHPKKLKAALSRREEIETERADFGAAVGHFTFLRDRENENVNMGSANFGGDFGNAGSGDDFNEDTMLDSDDL